MGPWSSQVEAVYSGYKISILPSMSPSLYIFLSIPFTSVFQITTAHGLYYFPMMHKCRVYKNALFVSAMTIPYFIKWNVVLYVLPSGQLRQITFAKLWSMLPRQHIIWPSLWQVSCGGLVIVALDNCIFKNILIGSAQTDLICIAVYAEMQYK